MAERKYEVPVDYHTKEPLTGLALALYEAMLPVDAASRLYPDTYVVEVAARLVEAGVVQPG